MRNGRQDPENRPLFNAQYITVEEIEGGESNPADFSCFQRRGAGCDGAVWFVDFVFLDAVDLVGYYKSVQVEKTV